MTVSVSKYNVIMSHDAVALFDNLAADSVGAVHEVDSVVWNTSIRSWT